MVIAAQWSVAAAPWPPFLDENPHEHTTLGVDELQLSHPRALDQSVNEADADFDIVAAMVLP